MKNDPKTIREGLSKPFAPEDLEWRIQVTSKDKASGLAVPYVTNRAIQDRLDDIVGPENWHNEYKPWHGNGKRESQICGISIYFEGRGFITKWDGAEDTDVESIKGGLSDSMKRAAVQWGVGRVLYKMNPIWVGIEQKGSSYVIKDFERARLNTAYLDMLRKLNLPPAQPGGLQPQLTPKQISAAQTQPSAQPSQQAPRPTPPPGSPVPGPAPHAPVPFPVRPAMEFRVLSAKAQSGLDGQPTMRLVLENAEGKKLNAFIQGHHPHLAPGAELYNVKLTMQRQDSVVFYILTAYQIISPGNRAA